MDNYKTLTETQSASLKPNVQSTIDLKLLRISPSAQYKTCRPLCQLQFLYLNFFAHSSKFRRYSSMKSAGQWNTYAFSDRQFRTFAPHGENPPMTRCSTAHSSACPSWLAAQFSLCARVALEPARRRRLLLYSSCHRRPVASHCGHRPQPPIPGRALH